eukprot:6114898-Pyramimonas_sp.AAC.1
MPVEGEITGIDGDKLHTCEIKLRTTCNVVGPSLLWLRYVPIRFTERSPSIRCAVYSVYWSWTTDA